ncbi:MAG: DedA family protein [Candidatus Micrarchaeota archaeon]|nr:DedA family protein [Candidatus Micrarchaeota archaeon]MDE1824521.1 DedA family protein [Candidatus Micrarchaeota archaeon]
MLFAFSIIQAIISLLAGASGAINAIISQYGYIGIFVLMTLESASMPIPSEVVLPAVGHFVYTGQLNIYIAVIDVLLASLAGYMIDYAIAYYVGKEVVYKHLGLFRIKKESIDAFDRWFLRNGPFAVFVARLLPGARGLINFPAGFAEMPLKKFIFYSMVGAFIWEVALIGFGYYALSTGSLTITAVAIALFLIALYLIYDYALKRIRKG